MYGNIILPAGLQQVHYFTEDPGMIARNGTLYYYSNTMPGTKIAIDTSFGGNGLNSYLQPRVDVRNSIFWPDMTRSYGAGSFSLNSTQTLIMNVATNLFKNVNITTPINPPAWNSGVAAGFVRDVMVPVSASGPSPYRLRHTSTD